jgi:hypothetical protein
MGYSYGDQLGGHRKEWGGRNIVLMFKIKPLLHCTYLFEHHEMVSVTEIFFKFDLFAQISYLGMTLAAFPFTWYFAILNMVASLARCRPRLVQEKDVNCLQNLPVYDFFYLPF